MKPTILAGLLAAAGTTLVVPGALAGPLQIVEIIHEHDARCGHIFPGKKTSELLELRDRLASRPAGRNFADPGASLNASLPLNPNGTAGQLVYVDFEGPADFTVGLLRLDGTLENYATADGISKFQTFNFNPAERQQVLQRLRADYAPFNYEFTDVEPTSGPYTTLDLNAVAINGVPNITLRERDVDGDGLPDPGFGISILFGQATEIDFRNLNKGAVSRADPNFWNFLAQAGFSVGLPTDEVSTRRFAVNQAANTGAHELGHDVGLRHHDALGPIGAGLNGVGNVGDPDNYIPPYPGPVEAFDTNLHLMGSGASTGVGLNPDLNRFFGLREAIKLTYNEQGVAQFETNLPVVGPSNLTVTLPEVFGAVGDDTGVVANIRRLALQDLDVPQTVLAGEEAGGQRFRHNLATSVVGRIELPTFAENGDTLLDLDLYEIEGFANGLLSVELISLVAPDFRDFDPFISMVGVFDAEFDLLDYYEAEAYNFAEGESFDSFIWDLILPSTGRYYVGVWSPYNLLPLYFDGLNPGDFAFGDYELYLTLNIPAPGAFGLLFGGLGLLVLARGRKA